MTTNTVWLPYGMPANRVSGKPKPKTAERVTGSEPMPDFNGAWMPVDEWWRWTERDEDLRIDGYEPKLSAVQDDNRQYGSIDGSLWYFDELIGKRKKTLKAKNGYRPFKSVNGKSPKAYKGKAIYHGYPEIAALFGNRSAVAYKVLKDRSYTDEALSEAVSNVALWAWEYARREFESRGKELHDRILPAHLGNKPPKWIERCVRNAMVDASRDDTYRNGSRSNICGECHGTGNETVEGYGLEEAWTVGPCETCNGTGKLTKRQWHRIARVTAVDPQDGKDFEVGANGADGCETSEALTSLNDPKYRNFDQPVWGEYQQQLTYWHEEGRPGESADYNYAASKLYQAAHWIDADAIPWLEMHELDGYSYQQIAEIPWVSKSKSTVQRRAEKLREELLVLFPQEEVSEVTRLRYEKWTLRRQGKPWRHLPHDPIDIRDYGREPTARPPKRRPGPVTVSKSTDAKVAPPRWTTGWPTQLGHYIDAPDSRIGASWGHHNTGAAGNCDAGTCVICSEPRPCTAIRSGA